MPAGSEWKRVDLEQFVAEMARVHLSDEELDGYLTAEAEELGRLRAEAHLRRCLICTLRIDMSREILALGTAECESFRPQLAEFARLSRDERERWMPALAAHLRECEECRACYRKGTSLWRQALDLVRRPGEGISKTLNDGLELALTQAGRLLQGGLGPMAEVDRMVHVSLSAGAETEARSPAAEGSWGLVWTLRDEDARASIRLEARGEGDEQVSLRCECEIAPGSGGVDPAGVRIEIRRVGEAAPLVSSPLSYFRREQLVLPVGSWLIQLQAGDARRSFLWEIPLTLRLVPEPAA